MTITKYEYYCNVLNIVVSDENDLSESLLKRQYHKFCLLYHPDKKNINYSSRKFFEVSEAYDFLRKYMGFIDDDNYDDILDDISQERPIFIEKVGEYILYGSNIFLSNEYVMSYVDSMDNECGIKKVFNLLKKYRH